MAKSRITIYEITTIAIMTALIAVCSWITVPTTIPFTMQTFAIFLALELLGGKNGTIAYAVYLALGAMSVPVFAGMKGGVGVLIGPTGGYLFGFVFSCILYWVLEKKLRTNIIVHIAVLVLGLALCYFFGTVWFVILTHRTVGESLLLCVVPFILPDVVKIAVAYLLGDRLRRIIKFDKHKA